MRIISENKLLKRVNVSYDNLNRAVRQRGSCIKDLTLVGPLVLQTFGQWGTMGSLQVIRECPGRGWGDSEAPALALTHSLSGSLLQLTV